jgi:prefoldin subunit 5
VHDTDLTYMTDILFARSDTKFVYINVGFGFHVQMTLKEALEFIEKKTKQLQTRAEKHTQEVAKIRANIKLVRPATGLKCKSHQRPDYDFFCRL